ncbi:bacillithiol biosynthesis cysteine-adding enzyme BshC [uncultured Polaribacter sp.]|uniref:bacillithiol biosynthesis cysteine-adding enzyme BshC n=1 Tax=uncultured Polaribacter sp. TaxID=174711 RepID=UPI00262F9B0E|nr:bacillithiol biosynthesis cysteine-adding enzyme BshC [uncultured Polaribacter sp.]
MKVTHIPYKQTGFFSKTMLDYLNKTASIAPFYNNFPDITGFHNQIEEKEKSFRLQSRLVLSSALKEQYNNFNTSLKTADNIASLKDKNTFTITTGHQLNLFTGPLYFLYKIISTINLCKELKLKFPSKNFVPIYWMASEDHDFDEINYFNFDGKKVSWNYEDGGAVGRFSTESLEAVFAVFSDHLGSSKNALFLKQLFSDAYLKHTTLTSATRYIANELFADDGLVIIDADDKNLKELFVPFVKDEFENKTSFTAVSKTIKDLEKEYKIQVNPREINLFYLGKHYRERIVLEQGIYKVNNTDIVFTKDEIIKELVNNPENFSPNVIMRPLYQEVILPNICYIGGGGEIAYWLELKAYFNKVNVPFPVLLLRNSVQIIESNQQKKLQKLNISIQELFLSQHQLIANKVIENANLEIDFDEKIAFLEQQFLELKQVAKLTDVTFINAVNAQERKQVKGLQNLQKRLLKAEKRRQKDLVVRISELQNKILPNQSLEERQRNFSDYYLSYGSTFVEVLKEVLQPLKLEFTVIEL